MAGKTLSNGTLSLRFMQNAQRAKQEQAVELQQAKVKDEAEWEVSEEIREAWGISSVPGQPTMYDVHPFYLQALSMTITRHSVTYESSYIPFLFPSLHQSGQSSDNESVPVASTSAVRINGRRSFKKGEEIIKEVSRHIPRHTSDLFTFLRMYYRLRKKPRMNKHLIQRLLRRKFSSRKGKIQR